ncbi:ABC transporter ATP-binding protein [Paractinoplanes rhizophilus]|uniref:ABC transporter ATP-binding protein n=1 Tax=Paractinoplanes rhizophilus TaxID=1416877 RepID=A0ABW2HT90_9ACTN
MTEPRTLATLGRTLRRAYDAEPRLALAAMLVTLVAAAPGALLAIWMKYLVDGRVWAGATGIAASCVAVWLLRLLAVRVSRKFRMRIAVALETHVARMQATVDTIEHHERPEYLDRLAVLREATFQLDHLYQSLFATISALACLALTTAVLATVSAWTILLTLFAAPTIAVSAWRSGKLRQAEEQAAPAKRRQRHLFTLATTPGPAKELRVTGNQHDIAAAWHTHWQTWYTTMSRAQWAAGWWQAAAWGLFAAGYAAAVAWTTRTHGAADVVLVVTAGARLGQYVAMTAGEADFVRLWLDASRRLAWLEDYAAQHHGTAEQNPPRRLHHGIVFVNVSFQYPGTHTEVLHDVNLTIPAGAVVAIVGENGAGKSTLVKLLCGLYPPTHGHIRVDGTDLRDINPDAWRARLAGAFQDFAQFEFAARRSIGLGDLPHRDHHTSVTAAVTRAGATDVVDKLPAGYDTQLGARWPGGAELSFGQWQRIALARGFMRDDPLLTVLDEPTAALDAETEHQLFERYAAQSRAGHHQGSVTLLVSHRFSTVRMADLIIVVQGSRVTEFGTHDALMAGNGTYAELYTIQARAYR